MEHPLVAVVVRLMADFPGHTLTVLRIVAECADEHPEEDPLVIEHESRARLATWLRNHDDGALGPTGGGVR